MTNTVTANFAYYTTSQNVKVKPEHIKLFKIIKFGGLRFQVISNNVSLMSCYQKTSKSYFLFLSLLKEALHVSPVAVPSQKELQQQRVVIIRLTRSILETWNEQRLDSFRIWKEKKRRVRRGRSILCSLSVF